MTDAAWRDAAERWFRALEEQGTGLHRAFDELAGRVARLEGDDAASRLFRAVEDQTTRLHRSFEALAERVARLERHDRVRTTTAWVEAATLTTRPLVSVVVPTRNRPDELGRALRSLVAQRYDRFEAVVVDDGGEIDARPVVDAFGDDRLRCIRTEPRGASAARNSGIDAALGSVVAYLDDDNEMDPLWLQAVVWALEQRPDVAVLYGAILIDDTAAQLGVDGWEPPTLWFHEFDRDELLRHNLADASTVAHRAGADGARYDERIGVMADWDFLLGLSRTQDPLALPVVACRYHSGASDRMSRRPDHERAAEAIRRKHTRR